MSKEIKFKKTGESIEKEIVNTKKETINKNIELSTLQTRKTEIEAELIVINKAITDLEKL